MITHIATSLCVTTAVAVFATDVVASDVVVAYVHSLLYLLYSLYPAAVVGAEGCSDSARDTLPASPTQADIATAQRSAETCAMKCADDHLALIPKLEARLGDHLSSKSK